MSMQGKIEWMFFNTLRSLHGITVLDIIRLPQKYCVLVEKKARLYLLTLQEKDPNVYNIRCYALSKKGDLHHIIATIKILGIDEACLNKVIQKLASPNLRIDSRKKDLDTYLRKKLTAFATK